MTAVLRSIPKTLLPVPLCLFLLLSGILYAGLCADSSPQYYPRSFPEGTVSGPQIIEPFPGVRLNLRSGWHMLSGEAMYRELKISMPLHAAQRVLILPDNGAWMAVLVYEDTGFVELSEEDFNSAAVRRTVQSIPMPDLLGDLRGIAMAVRIVGWLDPPAIDVRDHTARFVAQVLGEGLMAYGRGAVFGRIAYVGIRCVGNADGTMEENRAPLNEIMGSVYFADGASQEDRQAQDRIADLRPAQVLVGTAVKPVRAIKAGMNLMNMIWFGIGSMLLMALYRWTIARSRN